MSAAAEAVFSYLLQESSLADRVRGVLRIDPERRAFQTALAQGDEIYAGRHPDLADAFFDEVFLTGPAAPILAGLLTRRGQPDPPALAQAWGQHLGHADPAAVVSQLSRKEERLTRNEVKSQVIAELGHLGDIDRSIERIYASLTEWGLLPEAENGFTYRPAIRAQRTENAELHNWLLACALHAHTAGALLRSDLLRLLELYPFDIMPVSAAQLVQSGWFEVSREGGWDMPLIERSFTLIAVRRQVATMQGRLLSNLVLCRNATVRCTLNSAYPEYISEFRRTSPSA